MKKLLTLVSTLLFGCLVLQNGVRSIPSAPLPNEAESLAEMRIAGLHQNKALLPDLMNALAPSHGVIYNLTALKALAQMGAIEAIPKIEVLERSNDLTVANFARSAKARLIAENAVVSIFDDTSRTKSQTEKFYGALGVFPADINASVLKYYRDLKTHPSGAENGMTIPVEVYAMREVADMVYSGDYQSYALLPDVAQLDFLIDYPSALKMRLAPLSQDQRINTMVQDLANKQKLGTSDDYEIQLLSDEGLPASQAIAIQLQQMDGDRQHYKSVGFAALFRTLEAIGDRDQSPVIARFLRDKDGDVGYFARQVYYDLKAGLKRQHAPGY